MRVDNAFLRTIIAVVALRRLIIHIQLAKGDPNAADFARLLINKHPWQQAVRKKRGLSGALPLVFVIVFENFRTTVFVNLRFRWNVFAAARI